MSYIDRQLLSGFKYFHESFNEILAILKFNSLAVAESQKLHPLICAFLKFEAEPYEKNSDSPQIAAILLDAIKQTKLKSGIKDIDDYLNYRIDNYSQNVILLAPSDELLHDFCHTRIPDAANKDVRNFFANNLVYIDFPDTARKNGILMSAALVDIKNKSINCYHDSSGAIEKVGAQVKANPKKYRDEVDALIDMIALYFLSQNKRFRKTDYFSNQRFKLIKNKTKLIGKLRKQSCFIKTLLVPPKDTTEWRSQIEKRSWQIAQVFEVRGHWRWQPCGVGRVERKLIWINPHIKGLQNTKKVA